MLAFTLPGGLMIYTFPLLLGLGAGLGLAWAAGRVRPWQVSSMLDAGLAGLLGAVLVGRLVYVAIHWGYFATRQNEIPQVQLGGLAWPGAVLGACLAILLVARLTHVPFDRMLEGLIPFATVMAVCAWLACWLDGIAYGPAADAWWALPARDEWGRIETRLPVQLLGAALTMGLAWLVDRPRRLLRGRLHLWLDAVLPVRPVVLWAAGFSLTLLLVSLLRADPAPAWLGLRLDAWAAFALVLPTFTILVKNVEAKRREQR